MSNQGSTVVRADRRLVEVIMSPELHGIGYEKGRKLLTALGASSDLFAYLDELAGVKHKTENEIMRNHLLAVLQNGVGDTAQIRLLVANALLGRMGIPPKYLSEMGVPVMFTGSMGVIHLIDCLKDQGYLTNVEVLDRWRGATPDLAAYLLEMYDTLAALEVADEAVGDRLEEAAMAA